MRPGSSCSKKTGRGSDRCRNRSQTAGVSQSARLRCVRNCPRHGASLRRSIPKAGGKYQLERSRILQCLGKDQAFPALGCSEPERSGTTLNALRWAARRLGSALKAQQNRLSHDSRQKIPALPLVSCAICRVRIRPFLELLNNTSQVSH